MIDFIAVLSNPPPFLSPIFAEFQHFGSESAHARTGGRWTLLNGTRENYECMFQINIKLSRFYFGFPFETVGVLGGASAVVLCVEREGGGRRVKCGLVQ